MTNRVRRHYAGALILVLAIAGGTHVLWAQTAAVPAASLTTAATASPAAVVETDPGAVRLMVGRSAIVNVGSAITRVSLTSADIADAMVTAPGQLLVNGKMPGTISMFVWDKAGTLKRYEVMVQRDLARLSEQMRELFPAESISVQSNGRNIVLAGSVTGKDIVEKAVSVAAGYVEKKDEVVSLLQVQNAAPSNQVLLRVRFAEVSRSALTELGASLFTSPLGIENNVGRLTTQQFPAPRFEDLQSVKGGENWQQFGQPVDSASGKLSFSDFLNFFLFNEKYDLGVTVRALQQRGLFQSLAEPNLVAESGKDASFLAGGEFPIPVVQGSGANLAINVVFKEFGIRLNFTPTVNGDRVHLKVRPEVSTLDFNNAVLLQGFRIPALSTRRTETELELRNGQTFAISGLLNNQVTSTLSKVPGIGDIPILGYLFRSKAAQKNQTELVVMITPEILTNGSRGVTPSLPRITEPYLAPIPENRQVPQPPEAFSGERRGVAAPAAAEPRTVADATQTKADPAPAAAAATVSKLTPPSRAVGIASSESAATEPVPDKPLNAQEQRELEKWRKEEQARARALAKAEEKSKAEEEKRLAAQADADRRAAEQEKARQQKAAKEQARKDAEAQKRAEEQLRREMAEAREQQKAEAAAAEQLKAAQARYEAELAKRASR